MNDFPKEEFANRISKIQENLESLEKLCAIVSVPPKQAGLSQIKPYSFETVSYTHLTLPTKA